MNKQKKAILSITKELKEPKNMIMLIAIIILITIIIVTVIGGLKKRCFTQPKFEEYIAELSFYSIGDEAEIFVLNEDIIIFENALIRITDIYSGDDAESIIKEYCESEDSYFEFYPAPNGQNWQVAKYDLNYSNCESEDYVNIKITGLDGCKLYSDGISYSTRTFDIRNQVVKDGNWNRNYYVFYLVPDRCNGYLLLCGDFKPDYGILPSSYVFTNPAYSKEI